MKRKLAVLGRPIGHSRTPQLQTALARIMGDEVSCPRIDCGEDELAGVVAGLIADGYDGFNCTMPLKTAMAGMVSSLSVEAEILCSVNTVKIAADGKLSGVTTDGGGMLRALSAHGAAVAGETVVLLGAGGAARSIALALCRAGVGRLIILNRSISGANALADMLKTAGSVTQLTLGQVDEAERFAPLAGVLINATSCGMEGSLPFENLDFIDALPASSCVADAVYNPLETEMLTRARQRGLNTVDGLWMLLYQGVLAYEFWSGTSFTDEQAAAAYRELLTTNIN